MNTPKEDDKSKCILFHPKNYATECEDLPKQIFLFVKYFQVGPYLDTLHGGGVYSIKILK